ncbi:MAG: TadE family protein [Acidobacteriaceae bacterium]
MWKRCRTFRHRDDGQSMVEFGMVVPALLIVLTGIFSFGIILNQYEILTNAVNSGARAFALSRGQTTPTIASTDPCAYAIEILEADAPNLTPGSLTFAITYTSNKASPGTVTTYTTSCTSLATTMNTGDTVLIKATYPVTPMVFSWATKSLTLSASAEELVN